MSDISTKLFEYVIVFKDGSNKFVSRAAYDEIIEQSSSGMNGTEIGDMYLDFKMIGKMLTVKEFYEQYPKEKEKYSPPVSETAPRPDGIVDRVEQLWVKKSVSQKDWSMFYSRLTHYVNIGFNGTDIWMGFCTANLIVNGVGSPFPVGCFPMDDNDLMVMDNYCRANHIHPQPLEKVKVE